MSGPTLRYAALNVCYWAAFCLLIAFASVFLLARGLSNTEIGVTLAAAGLVSALLQPVVASAAQRSRWPLRAWLGGLGALIAGVSLALAAPGLPLVTTAVLYGLGVGLVQLALPLVNAIGMDAARLGAPVEFGPARAMGSLGFALTSSSVGALVAVAGPGLLPWLVAATQALFIGAALTFRFAPRSDRATDRDEPDAEAEADAPAPVPRSTAGDRRFAVLLVGTTLAFVSHAAINTFQFQVVESHGGTASDMGLAFTIAAGVEVVPMLFFRRIANRWHPGTLLRVAALMFAVKALATWLAPNLTAFLLTMLLQVVSFALVVPASVFYVDRLLPASERLRGQALMTLTFTLGNVIAGLAGGVVIDRLGVPALLAAGTAAAAAGAAAVAVGSRRAGAVATVV